MFFVNRNSEFIDNLINKLFYQIFDNKDLKQLSNLEKRLEIYMYLVNHIKYDYLLLETRKKRGPVNNYQEIVDVLTKDTGICSSISQVYKLLLEKINIESICFCCNDTTEIFHQILLVKENNSYSFDDITSVIVGRNDLFNCFGYDVSYANMVHKQTDFFGLPSEIIDAIIGRKTKKYNERKNQEGFVLLPANILSISGNQKEHFLSNIKKL